MVLLSIWGETFIAMWDRRNHELTFSWGVLDADELRVSKALAKEVSEAKQLIPNHTHSQPFHGWPFRV